MKSRRSIFVVALAAAAVGVAGASAENVSSAAGAEGKIAFLRVVGSSSHILVMNSDGGQVHELTSGPVLDDQLTWSPDARHLAFVRLNRPYARDIYVIGADGTGLRRLAHSRLYETDPVWSPDGRTIAYTARGFLRGKWHGGLYLMNADGSHKRRLDRLPVYNHAEGPAWSPDGHRIAFVGGGRVYVINADGTGQRRLTRRARGGLFPLSLAWSPDGSRLALVKEPGRYDSIYVIDVARGTERLVTRHAYNESGFAWRPDGSGIIYARERQGGVYSINLDGSGDHRLTRNSMRRDLSAGGFSWSPDSRTIAYGTDVTGRGDIYLMNPDGSRQRRLTRTPEIDGSPRWAPVRRVALSAAVDHVTLVLNSTPLGKAPNPRAAWTFGVSAIQSTPSTPQWVGLNIGPAASTREYHTLDISAQSSIVFDGTRGTLEGRLGTVLDMRMSIVATAPAHPALDNLGCRGGNFMEAPVRLRGTLVARTGTRFFGTIRRSDAIGFISFNAGGATDCTPAPSTSDPCLHLSRLSLEHSGSATGWAEVSAGRVFHGGSLGTRDSAGGLLTWEHAIRDRRVELTGSLPTLRVRTRAGSRVHGGGVFTAGKRSERTENSCHTTTTIGSFHGSFSTRFAGWGVRSVRFGPTDTASYTEQEPTGR